MEGGALCTPHPARPWWERALQWLFRAAEWIGKAGGAQGAPRGAETRPTALSGAAAPGRPFAALPGAGGKAQPGDNGCDRANTSPCAPGRFCDEHFGLCLPRRQEDQYCRRDAHCARGLLCMFGKCQQPAPDGQEGEQGAGRPWGMGCVGGHTGGLHPPNAAVCPAGARCRGDEDCGAGACCARQHGERVCKRRLALAQGCHVPPGGLAFSINQLCPCLEGLVCRAGEPGPE
uniref:Dickkopf N-terminal cysteine-rich domain-containing protein n=1 Tax=Apteryx owenii TaxID=8824 RepID=A0A8B9S375_APTOW